MKLELKWDTPPDMPGMKLELKWDTPDMPGVAATVAHRQKCPRISVYSDISCI